MSAREVLDSFDVDENVGLTHQKAKMQTAHFSVVKSLYSLDVWTIILFFTSIIGFFIVHPVYLTALTGASFALKAIFHIWQQHSIWKLKQEIARVEQQMYSVRRSSKLLNLEKSKLAVGDIIFIEPGMEAPMFIRLLKVRNLKVDESEFNGNSLPALKAVVGVPEKTVIYPGSIITSGSGLGICVSFAAQNSEHYRLHVFRIEVILYLSIGILSWLLKSNEASQPFVAASLAALLTPFFTSPSLAQREQLLARLKLNLAKAGINLNRNRLKEIASCSAVIVDDNLLKSETLNGHEARFRLSAECAIKIYATGSPRSQEKMMLNEGHWLGQGKAAFSNISKIRAKNSVVLGVSSFEHMEDVLWAADVRLASSYNGQGYHADVSLKNLSFESIQELILAARLFVLTIKRSRKIFLSLSSITLALVIAALVTSFNSTLLLLSVAIVAILGQRLSLHLIGLLISSGKVSRSTPLSF